jgi:hypothetical protein
MMPRCKRCPTAITCCGFGETVPREPAWRAYARACRRAYLPRPQRRALPRLDGEPVRNRVPDAREHAHIEEQRLRNVVEAFTRAAKVVPQARSASPWLAFAPRPAQSGTLRRGWETRTCVLPGETRNSNEVLGGTVVCCSNSLHAGAGPPEGQARSSGLGKGSRTIIRHQLA